MAVTKSVAKRTLSLSVARGHNVDGKLVTKSYVYSNVKPEAEDAKLMAVGQALGGLFDNDMTAVVVVERAELIEE